jgi:hypothetical protein
MDVNPESSYHRLEMPTATITRRPFLRSRWIQGFAKALCRNGAVSVSTRGEVVIVQCVSYLFFLSPRCSDP